METQGLESEKDPIFSEKEEKEFLVAELLRIVDMIDGMKQLSYPQIRDALDSFFALYLRMQSLENFLWDIRHQIKEKKAVEKKSAKKEEKKTA